MTDAGRRALGWDCPFCGPRPPPYNWLYYEGQAEDMVGIRLLCPVCAYAWTDYPAGSGVGRPPDKRPVRESLPDRPPPVDGPSP